MFPFVVELLISGISFLLIFLCFFKRFYLFIFREGGKEGERKGEKHQCVVASCTQLTEALVPNPGISPDWESNQQPFGSQAGTQSTEPHQPGQFVAFLMFIFLIFFFFFFLFFNISYNKSLVMMNSFSFTLSGKHFICPPILNDSFAE